MKISYALRETTSTISEKRNRADRYFGITIVPSLYAWFNIAASWDPYKIPEI